MSSQPPPQQPHQHHLHKKPTSFPDFIFTAFSLFIFFSSSNPTTSIIRKFTPLISFPLNPRRFVRNPTMSNPSSTNLRNPTTHPFPNPQSLSDWLRPRLPSDSFSSWGVKPGTKNVNNLWLELSEGETLLADSTPPVRTVEVMVVRVIGKDNKVLVESHQELSNGAHRRRGRPLSEKMKPGETVEDAVFRAVKEELGSTIVKILPNSYSKKVEERVSASYPGLPACYVLHTVDAVVDGLPEEEFCTEETDEYGDSSERMLADGAVSCKKHYWKWVDADSL
ncbi:uncharacterized protein LOC107803943 [Nicotiana tabacum]|uniref:Uncharacterized protein LOC107803943 n=1 Tax=Nicotiana tabacum TaxID=4097 RepID=A0A1S4B355_TOBAC|nr:uncharacterized protein LOC104096063 [Nicotiana tomentosiformis]XP_016483223.1 PREDICTED: uncharacterized protein LOC107803943 [Nicotiana tabacum]